jgi:hypothetical protein
VEHVDEENLVVTNLVNAFPLTTANRGARI